MTIEQVIRQVDEDLAVEPDRRQVVAVAGGSATGKSSQIIPRFTEALGADKIVVVEQDWYQLGNRFTDKDTSAYRWDDPRNFQLERLAEDLKSLRRGHIALAPQFDIRAMESIGERAIEPRSVILVDGIYSLLDPVAEQTDYGLYVTTQLHGRFLRRLFRTVFEQQGQPQTAFRHSLGPVLRAHRDIVSQQRDKANCYPCSTLGYAFEESIERYGLQAEGTVPRDAQDVWQHMKLRFSLKEFEGGAQFYVEHDGELYYDFSIEQQHLHLLEGVNFLEE